MPATNAALASGGMTHCFCRYGFFSVRPIVLSLARSTIFSSTTCSSSSCSVHRLRSLGGLEQAKAISFASAAPSKMRGLAEAGECLRIRTPARPSSASCWGVRAAVSTLVSRAAAISQSLHPLPASEASAFKQNACLGQLSGKVLTRTDQRVELFPLHIAELYHIPLLGNPFRGHEHLRHCGVSESEICRRINDRGY
jgi:hypothetical protein